MKRDLCYSYPKNILEVYHAYVQAIPEVFGKTGVEQNYHTISFDLASEFKYNMNNGACTVYLIPYGDATAVNVRYTVVQVAGARYQSHCRDMTRAVEKILNCAAEPADIHAESFMKSENRVFSADDPRCIPFVPPVPAPEPAPEPVPAPAPIPEPAPEPVPEGPQRDHKFCNDCGAKLLINARFCSYCGSVQRTMVN